MRNYLVQSKQFSRRAFLASAGQVGLLSLLGGRLYQLQVVDSDRYKTLSDGNRMRLYPQLPPRGRVFDRNGNVLAEGFLRYQAYYDPPGRKITEDVSSVLAELKTLLNKSDEEIALIVKRIEESKRNELIMVDDYLAWDEVAKLEVSRPNLPGVAISVPEMRNYPYGIITSHIIGYTGTPSENDIKQNPQFEQLMRDPQFRVGKSGIERSLEDRLRGTAGVRQVEVDARGHHIRELKVNKGTPGEDLTLTIDIELQKYVIEQIGGKGGIEKEGGSAIVLDVTNGDILALASVPGYDPNQFIRGVDQKFWNALTKNQDKPLNNKTIRSQYPPGSTFKPIVALAALHAGVINTDSRVYCPGHYDFGGRRFHCWERNGHGEVNVEEAIGVSCNVFFYEVSRRLGVDKIAEFARKFGLGVETGIELPGELSGVVPDREWKKNTLGKPWYQGETLNTGIGQGYTLVTPIQLAVAAARLASRGRKITPRLVRSASVDDMEMVKIDTGEKILMPRQQESFEQIEGILPWHMQTIHNGMNLVVNDPMGSVFRRRIRDEGMAFAGKTGTAQVVNRTFMKLPDDAAQRYHSLFIGYAPVQDPRYAIAVIIEHGGYGSQVAAPIAREILLKVQQLRSGE